MSPANLLSLLLESKSVKLAWVIIISMVFLQSSLAAPNYAANTQSRPPQSKQEAQVAQPPQDLAPQKLPPKAADQPPEDFKTKNKTLISQAVAEATNYFFTSREVKINYLLDKAMALNEQQLLKTDREISLESREFERELNGTLLEWVVAKEAESFTLEDTKKTKQAQEEFKQKTQKRLKKVPSWNELQVSASEFETYFLRKTRAQEFIRFKAASSIEEISDIEAKKFYDEKKTRFEGIEFESIKIKIKEVISRGKRDQRLEEWFKVLQKKYQVRLLYFRANQRVTSESPKIQ